MSTDLGMSRAQAQYDAQLPPSCYESEPVETAAESYEKFWDVLTGTLNKHGLYSTCENLSRPSTTSEWSNVDVTLGIVRGYERDMIAALRAAADAAEAHLNKFGSAG